MKTPPPQRASGRRKLAAAGQALPDDSFPIPDLKYLKRAIRSVGRAPASKRPALAALIRKRARELKVTGKAGVKGTWAFQAAGGDGRLLDLAMAWETELRGPGGKWASGKGTGPKLRYKGGAGGFGHLRAIEAIGEKYQPAGELATSPPMSAASTVYRTSMRSAARFTAMRKMDEANRALDVADWAARNIGPTAQVHARRVRASLADVPAKVSDRTNFRLGEEKMRGQHPGVYRDPLDASNPPGRAVELTGPGGWSHGWRRDGGAPSVRAGGTPGSTWGAKAPAPEGGAQLGTSAEGEPLRRGDRVTVRGGMHAGKTGTVRDKAGTRPGTMMVRTDDGGGVIAHGSELSKTYPAYKGMSSKESEDFDIAAAGFSNRRRGLDLASHFDPSQPRDTHGKWAHTPSWKPEHAREAAVPGEQRASGIWGGLTAGEHQAEVAKLTPKQLRVYNKLQTNGVSLPAALKYAKRGRMPAAPRPPAGMNTPNMRRAIRYGLLGANNRLGGISRARSSSAMNYASRHGKVVDLAMAMTRRMPVVNGAADVQLSRTGPGKVTVMHKSSGVKVGTLTQTGRGWQGVHASGAKCAPSGTSGGAVAGLVAAHNQLARGKRLPPAQQDGTASYAHEAGDGIDLAGSLPVTSASDGPRVTAAAGSGSGPAGLTGEAASIYARLIKKGLKPGQAAALAKRAAAMHAKAAGPKASAA